MSQKVEIVKKIQRCDQKMSFNKISLLHTFQSFSSSLNNWKCFRSPKFSSHHIFLLQPARFRHKFKTHKNIIFVEWKQFFFIIIKRHTKYEKEYFSDNKIVFAIENNRNNKKTKIIWKAHIHHTIWVFFWIKIEWMNDFYCVECM